MEEQWFWEQGIKNEIEIYAMIIPNADALY